MQVSRGVSTDPYQGIPFTQYIRPNGRQRLVYTKDGLYTENVYKKAQEIIDAGFWFEIEELPNEMISMTVTDHDDDWSRRVTYNTANVPINVVEMIEQFNIEEIKSRKQDRDNA